MGKASRLLYKLKRSWGTPIALYQESDGIPNRETGVYSISRVKINIKRGVVIPEKIVYSIANRAEFKIGDREIIVDIKELPKDFVLGSKDYFVYLSVRYNIVDYWKLDENLGYYFHVRRVQSQMPHQSIEAITTESLDLGDNSNVE